MISRFRRGVNEICAFMEFYAAQSGSLLPTFQDTLSVPSSRVKQSKKNDCLIFEDDPDRLSRNVGKNSILRCVKFQKSSDLSMYGLLKHCI